MTNFPNRNTTANYQHPRGNIVSRVLSELARVRPVDLMHPFNDPRRPNNPPQPEVWNRPYESPNGRDYLSRGYSEQDYAYPHRNGNESSAKAAGANRTRTTNSATNGDSGQRNSTSTSKSSAKRSAPRAISTEITADTFGDGLAPLIVGDAGAEVDPIIVDAKFGTGRQVPDTVIDGWRSDRFVLRSVSLRGRMHRYNGAPRQDSVLTRLSDDGKTLFVAVADGVSSAPQSHRGSAVAAKYATGWMLKKYNENLSQDDWLALAKGAAYTIQSMAQETGEDPMDFASTLVCAAITKNERGMRGHVLSIGDSGSWTVGANRVKLIEGGKEESDSSISSSAVKPLPLVPENLDAVYFESASDEAVLLGTDGIGDPLGGGGGPLSDLLVKRLYKRVPSITEFCHLVDFSKAGFDDDRTLIAVWPSHIGIPEH